LLDKEKGKLHNFKLTKEVIMGEDLGNEMEEIIVDFLQETEDILNNLDQDLVTLEETPDDNDLLNRIFRGIHTIKGTSGFLGFEKITKVAHRTEDILNKLRKEEIILTPRLMDVILEGVDMIKALFESISETREENVEIDEIVKRLETVLKEEQDKQSGKGEELPSIPEVPDLKDEKKPKKGEKEKKEEKKEEEDTPKMLGEILVEKKLATPKEILEAHKEQKKLGEILVEKNVIKEEDLKKVLKEQKKEGKKHKEKLETKTIRVDVNRLDNLMNQIGELVFQRNRLVDIVKKIVSGTEENHEDLREEQLVSIADDLNFITTQLQLAVLKMRMIPVGRVFNKFPRIVRDLSRKMNKEVELIISGEETELDKSVIEELNDPLVHIIRNSIDHGLESPEEREKIGKPRKGKIWLTAKQEGSFILISVKDDGKGMNIERIKEKAIERNLTTLDKIEGMSEKEIINFIFSPGFSTAQKVTNVSGRGVGMDVVKTNVKKINGAIDVDSIPGEGTEMILKLPLTLAIIQSLLVKVSTERFAIPLAVVVETIRIKKDRIKTIEGTEVLKLRDEVLPLLRVNQYFNISSEKELENPYVVVVKSAEKKIGLIVDNLLGQEEIVIKPLGDFLKKTKGISGATIMGDGKVTLIMDVATLAGEKNLPS
jgi:two-component system chemotaxis sensor kinase CheA